MKMTNSTSHYQDVVDVCWVYIWRSAMEKIKSQPRIWMTKFWNQRANYYILTPFGQLCVTAYHLSHPNLIKCIWPRSFSRGIVNMWSTISFGDQQVWFNFLSLHKSLTKWYFRSVGVVQFHIWYKSVKRATIFSSRIVVKFSIRYLLHNICKY